MLKIRDNKIEFIGYFACDGLTYRRTKDKECVLSNSLNFIPYDLEFSQNEMSKLLKVLVLGDPKLKITIEKGGD